jgi:hypothetical protein
LRRASGGSGANASATGSCLFRDPKLSIDTALSMNADRRGSERFINPLQGRARARGQYGLALWHAPMQ